jgi:hypothetical protein
MEKEGSYWLCWAVRGNGPQFFSKWWEVYLAMTANIGVVGWLYMSVLVDSVVKRVSCWVIVRSCWLKLCCCCQRG